MLTLSKKRAPRCHLMKVLTQSSIFKTPWCKKTMALFKSCHWEIVLDSACAIVVWLSTSINPLHTSICYKALTVVMLSSHHSSSSNVHNSKFSILQANSERWFMTTTSIIRSNERYLNSRRFPPPKVFKDVRSRTFKYAERCVKYQSQRLRASTISDP